MTVSASAYELAFLSVAAVLGVIGMTTWVLIRRRRDVWRALARKRGLRFSERSDGPRISGQISNRIVSVSIDDAGSDRDVGGVEAVRVAVGLRNTPSQLSAEGVPGLIGDLAMLTEERIDFGSGEFGRDVLVQGPESAARTYWTGPRQAAFLHLIQTAPCDQVILRDGSLIAELREIVSDGTRMEHLMDLLLAAATDLDGDSNQMDS